MTEIRNRPQFKDRGVDFQTGQRAENKLNLSLKKYVEKYVLLSLWTELSEKATYGARWEVWGIVLNVIVPFPSVLMSSTSSNNSGE